LNAHSNLFAKNLFANDFALDFDVKIVYIWSNFPPLNTLLFGAVPAPDTGRGEVFFHLF